MMEKYFVWDEVSEGLTLFGVPKEEDEQVTGRKKHTDPTEISEIYAPHAYLTLCYRETLNESEKLRFRKHYLRKISPNEPNVIILQDIKDLVLFLLITPVSPQFINFFHLPIVDRFLRALILYFQYYVEIWEKLMQERAATMKKAPNPLAGGRRLRYADEMHTLRCILGREYADLIAGCQDKSHYHHMTAGKRKASTMTQSQGEKDLRIFEVLLSVAHRVVWIALRRKYYNLIEIELHRLLRTDAYNTAERRSGTRIIQDMLEDDIRVLHGPKVQLKRKLLANSPLVQELIYSYCDFRLLSLGMMDNVTSDPRIAYLQIALLAEEEELPQMGIKVGILGQNRADYDLMLKPCEEETVQLNERLSEKDIYEKRKSIFGDSMRDSIEEDKDDMRLPHFKSDCEEIRVFPITTVSIDMSFKRYHAIRKEARKKWMVREMRRQKRKQPDTYSIATTID